ncbi:YihY family inner membrane protein [Streptomyces sp. I6]|nr:YihY family inner membrane protein [Streptomyces sp. I6]
MSGPDPAKGAGREAERGADRLRGGPDEAVRRRAPDEPTDLPRKSWAAVLRGTVREFREDGLGDRAAALTYYGILSLFPALLLLVALLGAAGERLTTGMLDMVRQLAPGPARDILTGAVQQLQGRTGLGSAMAVIGLALALWAASGYVAAFIRASNTVYDMPEGRPLWKIAPLRLALTAVLLVLTVLSAAIVVFTGGLARRTGEALGIEQTIVTVWSIAKWPVLVVLVTLMIGLLYWAAPNARGRGFTWVTPGSALAVLIWVVASAGFAFYASRFGSYQKIYGTLAGVIIFLVWLWITNLAVLLGLEFDAELSRQRAIAGGHPKEAEPYVEPRDTSAWSEEDHRRAVAGKPGAGTERSREAAGNRPPDRVAPGAGSRVDPSGGGSRPAGARTRTEAGGTVAVPAARTDPKSRISAGASAVAAQAKAKALRATGRARVRSAADRAAAPPGRWPAARKPASEPAGRVRTLAAGVRRRPGAVLAAGAAAGMVVLVRVRRRMGRR